MESGRERMRNFDHPPLPDKFSALSHSSSSLASSLQSGINEHEDQTNTDEDSEGDRGMRFPGFHSSQEELLSIQEQVKLQQLTVPEAETLFREWQLRHSPGGGEGHLTLNSKLVKIQKPKRSIVDKIFKKPKVSSSTPKSKQMKLSASPSIPEEQYSSSSSSSTLCPLPSIPVVLVHQELSSPRSSIASSGSRDSCMSKGSLTSGIETVDEEEMSRDSVYDHPMRSSPRRKSLLAMEQLEKDLGNPNAAHPPPLPPRNPSVISLPALESQSMMSSSNTSLNNSSEEGIYMEMNKVLSGMSRMPRRQDTTTSEGGGIQVRPGAESNWRKLSCPALQHSSFSRVSDKWKEQETLQEISPSSPTDSDEDDYMRSSPLGLEPESPTIRKLSLPTPVKPKPIPPLKKKFSADSADSHFS